MTTSLSRQELQEYISKQLNYFFPDNNIVDLRNYNTEVGIAIDRLDYCFKHCVLQQYNNEGETYFNHLYSDHYVLFLWFLANTIWKEKADKAICNKLYYLNKALNGFDCMYNTNLPDIFLVFHGSGTILGKGDYSNFFVVFHGCTVGSHKGIYPSMDIGVSLTAHSSLIGDCKIGKNVSVSAYTNVFETNIPDNQVVYNDNNGEMIIKKSSNSFAQSFFNLKIT